MKESQLHQAFGKWLDREGIPFVHSRTDKRHTNAVGDPDFFVLLAGRVLAIEFKVGSNKLSEAQARRIEYLRHSGVSVKIVRSVEQAVSAVQTWLGVGNDFRKEGDATCREDIMTASVETPNTRTQVAQSTVTGNAAPVVQPDSVAANLFIGTIGGKDYVLSGDSGPGGEAKIVRMASAADLINIRRRT